MGITLNLYDGPIYLGGQLAPDVPYRFEVSIGSHPYMVDLSFEPYRRDAFRHRSIPSTRPASDVQNITGENSINTQGLWRRSAEDWSHGAGQLWFDKHSADTSRFHQSKGINPWTPWQIALHNDTNLARASVNTNLYLVAVNGFLYVTDGTGIVRTADVTPGSPTWTSLTGLPATAATAICTDGTSFYSAHGADGIYSAPTSSTVAASFSTGTYDTVAYVKGRLMAAHANLVYNIIASGAGPSALYTHPNASFTWAGFAEGPAFIYGAGSAGNKSIVYRFGIATDGTTLVAPISCGTLPPGEVIYSIADYANTFIVLGTNLGVRFCTVASNGDLSIGSTIPVNPGPTLPVRAFASYLHYIWFGWSNFDATSTGLGRMDLQSLIDPSTPAFASDLMATTQGEVLSLANTQKRTVFSVSGVGVYVQTATFVAKGQIDSGLMAYDIPDDKIAQLMDVRYSEPMTGTCTPLVAVDGGAFTSVGSRVAGQSRVPFNVPQMRGCDFETRLQLVAGAANSAGPTVTRAILKALPGVASGTMISVTLMLNDSVTDENDSPFHYDLNAERGYLEGLYESQQVVTYQEGAVSYQVTVDSLDWLPYSRNHDKSAFNAVVVAYLKTVSG